jgi:cell division protein FtsB
MTSIAIRSALLSAVFGLAGGLGLGLWQVRETSTRFEARLQAEHERTEASLDRIDRAVKELQEHLERDVAQAGSERNDLRARLQDITLEIDDLRLAAQPLVAEIPELPIAPQ